MTQPLPVSIKGVVLQDGGVWLAYNEREEWELPGGRLEPGETPEDCLLREVQEEMGIAVEIAQILHAWVFEPIEGRPVFLVAYLCRRTIDDEDAPQVSAEHHYLACHPLDQLEGLALPDGYRAAIAAALCP